MNTRRPAKQRLVKMLMLLSVLFPIARAQATGETLVSHGNPNGSLDDRLQVVAYKVFAFDQQNGTATAILPSGIQLVVNLNSNTFNIVFGGEPTIGGVVNIAEVGGNLHLTLDVYPAATPESFATFGFAVSAGELSGQLDLDIVHPVGSMQETVFLAELYTNVASTAYYGAFVYNTGREATIAPEYLRGFDEDNSWVHLESLSLAVLAAVRAEVITTTLPEPPEVATVVAQLQLLVDAMGPGQEQFVDPADFISFVECKGDCNSTWLPIITTTLNNLRNVFIQAEALRSSAKSVYDNAVATAKTTYNNCVSGCQSGMLLDAVLNIGIGVPSTAALTIVTFPVEGPLCAVTAVTGIAGTTGALIADAFDATACINTCGFTLMGTVAGAVATRNAAYSTADAMVAAAKATYDGAVADLVSCIEDCGIPSIE